MYPLLPAPPSMYSSLSESTVLSSADVKPETVYTFFEASDDFLQFLATRSGMHEILLFEDTLNIDIMLEKKGFGITHSPDVNVKPIEMGLRKLFYDVEFTKCLRLSTLRARCPVSQEMTLTPAQYALLHEVKLAVTRNAGLADILMDYHGRACMFGSPESIVAARLEVKRLFSENGMGPFEFCEANPSFDTNNNRVPSVDDECPSLAQDNEDWATDVSRTPIPSVETIERSTLENTNTRSSSASQIQSTDQSGSSNSFAHGSQRTSSDQVSAGPSPVEVQKQRKSIRFLLNIVDAPRLIGPRGANKRRIEQLTGCSILLHTEKKEFGEFPVEIFAPSTRRCETARQYILSFLSGGQGTVDEVAAKLSGSKGKEVRVRPKIHLDISPKKLQKKHTD
ncbi:unnamed protein product [Cylicocyclus nassatus]|uniref:K Homology domain-containing protein n=1 Tax=Cylicocyclus nassatus TaxID=53992 RepID=A0AA36GUR6_CYLNA|nr:unnamed protein product [Cylicocyclus nassatus]